MPRIFDNIEQALLPALQQTLEVGPGRLLAHRQQHVAPDVKRDGRVRQETLGIDMLAVVCSKTGVSIRLTDERWAHIVEEHTELAGLHLDVLEAGPDSGRERW